MLVRNMIVNRLNVYTFLEYFNVLGTDYHNQPKELELPKIIGILPQKGIYMVIEEFC